MRFIHVVICLLLALPLGHQATAADAQDETAAGAQAELSLEKSGSGLGLKLPASTEPEVRPARVYIGQTTVFNFRAPRAGRSPSQRAADANRLLREIVAQGQGADIQVETLGSVAAIYINKRPIVQLTERDAALEGDSSTDIYANRIAAQMDDALHREWRRTAVAGTIFDVSLGVLFTLLALILWRRAWRLSDRASQWLKTHPNHLPPLQLRSAELLNRATVHSLLTIGAVISRWIILFGIFYAWLIAIFSLFGQSRGLTDQLTTALLSPVATLSSRVGAALPSLLIALLALLPLLLVLRVARIFFEDVASGAVSSRWLSKDLAVPAGRLAEFAIIIAALVLVAPVITGNLRGAAPQLGLLALLAVTLATVPLLAAVVVGGVTLFGRRLSIGDWVDFGGHTGRIANISLLDTTVRDREGVEIRVPHLARLWRPINIHGRHGQKRRVSAPFVLDRKLLTPAFAEKLEKALYAAGSNPHVRLVDIQATQIQLEISVTSTSRDARSNMLWIALNLSTSEETGTPVEELKKPPEPPKPQMPAEPKSTDRPQAS